MVGSAPPLVFLTEVAENSDMKSESLNLHAILFFNLYHG
jgi:hypothetical protein